MRIVFKLMLIGIGTGFLLGAILKGVQFITGKYVYTLLLNVDYIPIIRAWEMSEAAEFSLHLIVSIVLVNVLYFLFRKLNRHAHVSDYVVTNGLIGLLLYFTTALSDRTPHVLDGVSILYWVIAHIVYGAAVGVSIRYLVREKGLKTA
ncbi:hypothetical protein ACLIBH_01785 [Virgibacillus sp. W0430]|uniref:hypothetical protein n=1 Tax=Virgibacillus sp. W0430 TaxID=3391580 RepID=UPI003F469B2D